MNVNDLLIFVRVIQAGGFSKASELLRMPKSTISRRVADFEKSLGVPLIQRTTRSLRITEIGSAYYEYGMKIAAEVEKADSLLSNLQSIPQGTLKITAPIDFGNQFLAPVLQKFLRENPEVVVNTVLTERVVDIIGEGFDLAIRIGQLKDSSLVSRKLGSLIMQLYASPGYLKERGTPKTCSELEKHDCITFTGDEEPAKWHLKSGKEAATVSVTGCTSSNNMALVRELCVLGEGIALLPRFFCLAEVKSGRLKPVLKEWKRIAGPIHVVFPGQKFVLPKVRAFIDCLIKPSQSRKP